MSVSILKKIENNVVYNRFNPMLDAFGYKVGNILYKTDSINYRVLTYIHIFRQFYNFKSFNMNILLHKILSMNDSLNVWHGCTYRLSNRNRTSVPFVVYDVCNLVISIYKNAVTRKVYERTKSLLEKIIIDLPIKITNVDCIKTH